MHTCTHAHTHVFSGNANVRHENGFYQALFPLSIRPNLWSNWKMNTIFGEIQIYTHVRANKFNSKLLKDIVTCLGFRDE
jgi:hypothetical protein